MEDKISKILTLSIILTGGVFFFMVFIHLDFESEMLYSKVSLLVEYSIWLFYIAIAITLVLSILNVFKNPKGLKKITFSLLALIFIFSIAYMLSSGSEILSIDGQVLEGSPSVFVSKIISTLINYAIILMTIAVTIVIFTTIRSGIK